MHIIIDTLEKQSASMQARKYDLSRETIRRIVFEGLDLIFAKQKPQKYETLQRQLEYNGAIYNEYSYHIEHNLKTIFRDAEYILQIIREYCEDTNQVFKNYGR